MKPPLNYPVVEMSSEEIEAERVLLGGLADSVRDLADASLRTTVSAEVIAAAQEEIQRATARLRAEQVPGALGVSLTSEGVLRDHGNAAVGLRNPIAPPLLIERSADGRARSSFLLGALHEGPPGMVHGGVAALVLDQLLGEAAAAGGAPGMTGSLQLRYVRGTPLGECSAEAWLVRVEGVKSIVHGEMRDAEGQCTVQAEAVFILPRWARSAFAQQSPKPPRFE